LKKMDALARQFGKSPCHTGRVRRGIGEEERETDKKKGGQRPLLRLFGGVGGSVAARLGTGEGGRGGGGKRGGGSDKSV